MIKKELRTRNNFNNGTKAISFQKLAKDLSRNKYAYLMVLPVVAYYLVFWYKPMYGALIAFEDYSPIKGVLGSKWIWFQHFTDFFSSYYFVKILKNTIIISFSTLIFTFPAPIIIALLINEIKSRFFARTVQTISYMPHFISIIVVCGLIRNFTSDTGVISEILGVFGVPKVTMLSVPVLFVPIYVISEIWQETGWNSIIYLAALSSIDQCLYEAADIDGASRMRKLWNITLPGIAPTIVILFILRMGYVFSLSADKILLLYSPVIYDTSDVISTYVYRKGILTFSWSESAAVGLFNSAINYLFLVSTNWFSRKMNDTSLW